MHEPTSVAVLVGDLFRRESGHFVAALVRLLGPAQLALAEDVVHDALISALHAWRFAVPADPKAWLLQVAKRRAIDVLRRDRRWGTLQPEFAADSALTGALDLALSPQANAENQLALMLAICDEALAPETQITLILRLLSGFSAAEIAHAFLLDVATIDRRLHRGRARLAKLETLVDESTPGDVQARQPAVEQALYLLFNEGYQCNSGESAALPALCADALLLTELLLTGRHVEQPRVHALAALLCLNAARLPARLDADGALVPLAEQDRSTYDPGLIARGIEHLGASATGAAWTRWHLEAGIALEHSQAPSFGETNWARIAAYYDALCALVPSPVIALNRALAVAERDGVTAGQQAIEPLRTDSRLERYSFFWAARADLARRAGDAETARELYARAAELSRSSAEQRAYAKRIRELCSSVRTGALA